MKKTIILLLICLILSISLFGCSDNSVSDALRFKKEYENLNNEKNDDGSAIVETIIDSQNSIRYVNDSQIIDAFNNGTHVIYMGWPTCGWCRRMLPVLLKTVNEYSGIYVYYFNIKEYRDAFEKNLNNDKAKLYKQIVDAIEFDDYDISSLVDCYPDGSLKLNSSLVYFIKEGEIIGVTKRTVDSHIDPYEPLNDEQQTQLSDIYRIYLNEMIRKSEVGCNKCD